MIQRSIIALGLICAAASVTGSAVGKNPALPAIKDNQGKGFQINPASRPVTVVAFLGIECPLVKLYVNRLNEIANAYPDEKILLVGVDANEQDAQEDIDRFAKDYRLKFPVYRDEEAKLADAVSATRTPEVFVIDSKGVVRYQGRIDDHYGVGYSRPAPTRHDLKEAIDEVLAGKDVSVPYVKSPGCFIGRSVKPASSASVTYASDVAAIFNAKCVECHRSGEIGPFSMTSYEETAPWGATIQEVVNQGRMPPWFADPQYGTFAHNPSLTKEEKEKIDAWVDAGCPEGDPAKTPPLPSFTDGWLMEGTPDVVFKMNDTPVDVPAEGEVDYKYFTVEKNLQEDTWILGAESRAGDPSVVHHILVFCKRPGKWYPPGLPGELISAYAPGMKPTVALDDSMGLLLPKGSQIIMQMHYTPNGRATKDLSYFGLKLHPDPSKIKWEMKPGMAINFLFNIPAHADNHKVPAMFVFPEDSLLLGVNPHMHKRGKAFIYEAVYPDGTRETIMNCPKFDFNWQLGYQYVEPLKMPKGTKLSCTAYFDNSKNNLSNPNPNVNVRFGEQTWDEMMIGWLYYAVPVGKEVVSLDGSAVIKAAKQFRRP